MGMAAGGLFGTGLGRGRPWMTPFAESDFILPSLAEELGLFGIFALLLLYALFVERGLRTALGVRDGFGKLLAVGLAFSVALQVFVVIGGVTRVIPLTGLTTPFLSLGGSALLANWSLTALLLRITDQARRPVPEGEGLRPPPPQPQAEGAQTQVVAAVNTPILRISRLVGALFAALLVAATVVQFVQAPNLRARSDNRRTLLDNYSRERGSIILGDQQIALSTPVDDELKFLRQYPQPLLYSHVTGYYSYLVGAGGGLEGSEDGILSGSSDSLFYRRISDLLTGRQPTGASIVVTVNPKAQEAASKALGNQRGAVVALNPKTGAILAMVSHPQYDPNTLSSHDLKSVEAAWQDLQRRPRQAARQPGHRRQPLPARLGLQDRHRGGRPVHRHRQREHPDPGARQHGPARHVGSAAQLRPEGLRAEQRDHAACTPSRSRATPPSAGSG